MKQIIRYNVFETNSSSYHTLTIRKIAEPLPKREINKGEDIEIDPSISIKYIRETSSYQHVSRSSYEKAQSVLRFMSYNVIEQLDSIIPKELYYDGNNYDWNKKYQYYRDYLYKIPLIEGFVKAIKRYIGDEYAVTIKLPDKLSYELWDCIEDEACNTKTLFNVTNLTDVDQLAESFYDIIFNDSVEMIEECESNE